MRTRACVLTVFGAAIFLAQLPTSAAAETTSLCRFHEDPCLSIDYLTSRELVGSMVKLLSSVGTVECSTSTLSISFSASLATFLSGEVTNLSWATCKLGATSCTVVTSNNGGVDVLRSGLNEAGVTLLGTEIAVECGKLINCKFKGNIGLSARGASFFNGNGEFSASKASIPLWSGIFCPKAMEWDGLYEATTAFYIVS